MMLGRGGGGGEDSESLGRIMAGMPLQLGPDMAGIHARLGLPQPQPRKGEDSSIKVPGGMANPQWNHLETRDLISIRAVLERDASLSKRNKTLWEAVAARMRDHGHRRTPEQCKCKWKNLVNRYKGKETSDPENGKQCPFFDELHAVFMERAKTMQRHLLESEASGPSGKKQKRPSNDQSSDDFSDDDMDDDVDSDEAHPSKTKKKRSDRGQPQRQSKSTGSIQELLQEFIQQQLRLEMQWQEMMERRAHERRVFEQEWRESMEKLERERLIMEQSWREREEQRRMKEEARAEKREALLTTLLNKLIQDGL